MTDPRSKPCEFVWEHRRCERCRGTGFLYLAGERTAVLTCRRCLGNGHYSRIVRALDPGKAAP